MTPDALQVLERLQRFLQLDVLPLMPKSKKSDVRAAIKNLANARQELDELYPLLVRECEECDSLCREADLAMSHSAAATRFGPGDYGRSMSAVAATSQAPTLGPSTLSALIARHAAQLDQVGDCVLRLQRDGGADAALVLDRIYRVLGEQSRKRLPWQSVFAPDQLVSEQLSGTWTDGGSP